MIEKMKRLKRELMYKGSILDIYKDTMEFANGKQEEWDLSRIEWAQQQFFRFFRTEESLWCVSIVMR